MADEIGEAPAERPVTEPRLLTISDVATYLSVSEAQVYALVRSSERPAVKLGGRGVWRVDRQRLEEYIERLHEETKAWTEQHPPLHHVPGCYVANPNVRAGWTCLKEAVR